MNKKLLKRILLIIAILLFLISGTLLIIKLWPKKENLSKYKKQATETNLVSEEELIDNPIDFAALQAENPNVAAYITVDGTVVDYPIMRSGDNTTENFYLDHDWHDNYSAAGAIYMQRMNSADMSDNCTLLYGHNMKNGSMFAGIRKFRNKDFFNQNRYIHIYTPGSAKKYEIISAFTYDDRHILNSFNFYTQEGYNQFVDACIHPRSLSAYNISDGAELNPFDKLVVLSTCTDYSNNQRYLVVGKLVEDLKTK